MIANWIRRAPEAGLLAGLLLGLVGCGGKAESVDNAIVTLEPGINPSAGVATPTGAADPATTKDAAPAAAPKGDAPAAPAATTKSEGWGTLKGRVIFGGDAPTPKILVKQGDASAKDPAVCAAQPIPSQALVVDKDSKGVKYAVVYIPKPTATNPEATSAAAKSEVVFDQERCTFEPHVLGVMKGGKVLVKSSDKVAHNVDSKLQNTKFNTSLQPGQSMTIEGKSLQADRFPGRVVCDIHPWMTSYWLISDSPYYAVTDEKGNFEIKNVPAGTQKVVVWQEAVGPVTAGTGEAIDIKAGGDVSKDFTIDPGKVKPEG